MEALRAKAKAYRDRGSKFDVTAACRIPNTPLPFLLDIMLSMGPSRSTGMGEVATDFPVIESYLRLTNRELDGWEVDVLRDMCLSFVHELHTADDPFSIAPVDRIEE